MKKTRKILSIVLAVLFAFSSMPVVYVGTGAADAATYAADGKGTIDNPTRPVEASGSINRTDLYKLNINSQSTSYTFYQTRNDEYFTYGQTQGLQNYYETDVGSRTLTFESIKFYEGASEMDGATDPKEISPGFGRWETPLITNNPTKEFLSKYYVSSQWKATNGNASGVGSKPENFVLQGAWTDIGGCRLYTWQNDVIFKGNSADVTGEINTGYYEQLFWNWTSSDFSARFDLRIGTTLRVLDARELANEMAEAEDIIANADEYTKEYVSSVEATLNTIPDDLRDFSKAYSQSEIDKYTQMLKDVSMNSADYTEFNQLYKNLKGITNAKDAYTETSFNAFKAEIAQINANLPKNLDKTKQSTVDAATQALRDAFEKLVIKGKQDTNSLFDESVEDLTIQVGNSFKFIQIKDNQVFSFTQPWTFYRGSKDSDRRFNVVLDTSDANTNSFIAKLDPSCILTGQSIGGDAIDGTLSNATIFRCWDEIGSDGAVNTGSNAIKASERVINQDYAGFGNGRTYYLQNTPIFTGMSADVTGEQTYTYNQKVYVSYYAWFRTTYNNTTVPTTITITDARHLVKAVADANQTLANPGTHSAAYITALQAAVDSVPVEMLRGVEYFTQAEVDKLYNDITTIPENVADYSEFVEVFEWMKAENKDKYTENSYNAFIDEIYAINQNLPKNLTVDQQATIDEAIYALYAAHDKLVSSHLNDDNVITQEDIEGISDIDTNNPLAFTLASTQYNFMQVADGQKFAIRTDLTVRNSKSRYTCQLLSLRFSAVTADTTGSICEGRESPDTGCHNGEKVTLNQGDIVVVNVEGVNVYDTINDAGDIAEHNTWVNTKGVALSTNGILNDPTTLSTSDSSAYAEMYYTGPTGDHEANSGAVDITFAYRLGWQYYEQVLGFNGTTVKRHAHIPVNIKITDARALNALYEESDAILKGKTDKTYTFASLLNLYNAFNKVDPDMAYGSEYFTQEQVDAAYADLKGAYEELVAGADYSEYFKAYVKAEEIISSGNTDSRGNALYEEDAYSSFVETVTNIDNGLDKGLVDTTENQATIDTATQGILSALSELENYELADYSKLNDAMTEAEKILAEEEANPGTYTQETIDAIQNAYDNALENAFNNAPDAVHKELHVDQQATVDAAASVLEAALADKEFKADYSEFEEAYNKVKDIIDNPGKYTEETVKAAQDAINNADDLDKDLADTAENRQTIKDATDALNNVLNGAEETADYTKFNEAYKKVEEIANDTTGKYTDETIQAAKDALAEADTLERELPPTEENQAKVDEATSKLENMLAGAEEKADYSGIDEAIKNAEEIVNNPDKYTDETVKNAQDALDAAENLDKDLPKSEQGTVDKVIQDLIDSVTNAKEKADYSGLDEAIKNAEEIVNNPDKYTEETVKNAQNALDAAENLNKDLEKNDENQAIIDGVIQDLIDSVTNAKEKADYTDYNNAKTEADNLVNDDGNGNPIYDEEIFQQYKDAVEELDSALDKNLSEDDQEIVDKATDDLIDLRTELDATITDPDKIVIDPETSVDDTTVKDIIDEIINDLTQNGDYTEDEIIVEFRDYTGKELAGEEFVGTGSTMRVILKSSGKLLEYKMFIVMGDVDGNGQITKVDYDTALDVALEMHTYSEENYYFLIANDMDEDTVIDVLDVTLIERKMK